MVSLENKRKKNEKMQMEMEMEILNHKRITTSNYPTRRPPFDPE